MARGGHWPRIVTSERRWDSLDSLRGIAALLVVTFHCSQVTAGFATYTNPLSRAAWGEPWTWLKYTPLRILVSSGPSAVVLFFVLSGFVLSLPFLRDGQQPGYLSYAVRRICRIYLPFAAAILVSVALYGAIRPAPIPALSTWFNIDVWDQPLSLGYVLRDLAMTGLKRDMTLDPVIWSLVHELRISLVFPVLVLLTLRWPVASMVVSVLFGVACTAALAGREAGTLLMSGLNTGQFVFLFTAGILIARNVAGIRGLVERLPRVAVAILWMIAIGLILSPGPTIYRYFDFVWGAGAAMLLMLTVGSTRVDRALTAAPLVWLGRISYSLYLVHLPLLVGAVHLAYGVLPMGVILAVVIALSLLCAETMHRFVEVPSIRLGRTLARRIEAARTGTAPGWVGLGRTLP